MLALVTSAGSLFAASGTCGDNLTWDLTDGVLTISGTGAMTDYSFTPQSASTAPWAYYSSSIQSVSISEGCTYIGSFAFLNSTSLNTITIPNSVASIGGGAFSGCQGLPIIDNIRYADTYLIEAVDKTLSSYIIKEGTRWIGSSAFSGCSSLTAITILNSVTSIGEFAFMECSGLTTVTMSNNIISIGGNAFRDCSSLTSIEIPNSVTYIGENAFQGCNSLIAMHISDIAAWCSISFGNESANPLRYVHNLYLNGNLVTDLVIPDGVTNIGDYAFYDCTSLTSVTIPDNVTNIGQYAFFSCSGLTSVTIPNSVTSIGINAFNSCGKLTSITIPHSVTSIGHNAFYRCSKLANIYVKATNPPSITSTTFSDISSNALVQVKFGYAELYKSADFWKDMNIRVTINHSMHTSASGAVIDFTTDGVISSCGIEGGEQQAGNVLEYIGLEPNSEYNDVPVVLTANTGETETINVSFTTTALELTTKASKPVSSTTAILLAETNMSDAEVNCGFEYKRNDAPDDMAGTKVFCPVASGQMAGRLKNLHDDTYYKYRAFYQSAAGNMYYGEWQYIFTGDATVAFEPVLYTYSATIVREDEATISGYALAGSEDFDEQGFEYWAESRVNEEANAPARMSSELGNHVFVQADGIALRATLTDLDAGTVYRYRVYGKVGGQYYYGTEQTFTTQGTYKEDAPEAIESVESTTAGSTSKFFRNGQILIRRGEKVYTLQGQEVRE